MVGSSPDPPDEASMMQRLVRGFSNMSTSSRSRMPEPAQQAQSNPHRSSSSFSRAPSVVTPLQHVTTTTTSQRPDPDGSMAADLTPHRDSIHAPRVNHPSPDGILSSEQAYPSINAPFIDFQRGAPSGSYSILPDGLSEVQRQAEAVDRRLEAALFPPSVIEDRAAATPSSVPSSILSSSSIHPNFDEDLSLSQQGSHHNAASSTVGDLAHAEPIAGVWYNTDRVPGISSTSLNQIRFRIQETTSSYRRIYNAEKSFQVTLLASPDHIQWAIDLRVGHTLDLTHIVKRDLKNAPQDPRLVLLGANSRTGKHFGVRLNLRTNVIQGFPLFIRDVSAHSPVTLFHPWLTGCHSKIGAHTSDRVSVYAVAHAWGGPRICKSYATAVTLNQDLKLRCQHLITLELDTPHQFTSLSHLPHQPLQPGRGFPGSFDIRMNPEEDTPSASGSSMPSLAGRPRDDSSSEDESEQGDEDIGEFQDCNSNDSPGTDSRGTTGWKTVAPAQLENNSKSDRQFRSKTITHVSDKGRYKIPDKEHEFNNWLLLIRSEVRGESWSSGGVVIHQQLETTPANKHLSYDFSVLLHRCVTQSSSKTYGELLQGHARTLLESGKGCELMQFLIGLYKPVGAKWRWKYEAALTFLRHEQKESIPVLAGRLLELVHKLRECGQEYPESLVKLKLVILACTGPYHTVFDLPVRQAICINDSPDWDLATLSLSGIEKKLDGVLRNSRYYPDDGHHELLPGSYPTHGRALLLSKALNTEGGSKSNSSSNAKDKEKDKNSFGWLGQADLSKEQVHQVLQKWQCPVCRRTTHSFTECGVVKGFGFQVTAIRKGSGSGTPSGSTTGTGGPSNVKWKPDTKPGGPPGPAGPTGSRPPPPPPPGSSNDTKGSRADAPSIGSAGPETHSDAELTSDEESTTWNAPNSAAVARVEAHRARAQAAAASYAAIASHEKARSAEVTTTNPRVQSLSSGSSTPHWTPDKLARARKSTSSNVGSYACADSGASRDLFPDREYFCDYQDIQHLGKKVIVADDSEVLIHGIGTVRCRLDGHEVLLRRVYHVPDLNGALLSIRTHRRRGPGCAFVADHTGCFLTFPDFTIEVDDDTDVLIPLEPSHGTALGYEQPVSPRHRLRAARTHARRAHVHCRRSRVERTAPHLVVPTTEGTKTDDVARPIIPTHYVPDSASCTTHRLSSHELHRSFGCRKLKYELLPHLGSGLHVTSQNEGPTTIGDTVNINRGARGGPVPRPPRALHTVGADIGYGEGTGPGGYSYCLFLVDLATRHTFIYGLPDLSGDSLTDALWRFFVDAGGFPKRFRCDFDRRFIHGKVGRLLRSHGVRIGASPPHRQSQNGAVERNWNTAVEMGRAFLAEANLPKRYWYWAVREAVIRMNMLPVRSGPSQDDAEEFNAFPQDDSTTDPQEDLDPELIQAHLAQFESPQSKLPDRFGDPTMTPTDSPRKKKSKTRESLTARARKLSTPMELFYGVQPDYRVLFQWGSIGYYRRTIEKSGAAKSKFSSKSHLGIALGRSDYANGMMFWDPTTSRFSVSADYRLDPDRGLGDPFPSILYDGGMSPSLISSSSPPKEAFPPNATVYGYVDDDVFEGTVVSVPTPSHQWYSILPTGSNTPINVSPVDLSSPDDPILELDRRLDSSSELPSLPQWMQQDTKITLDSDGVSRRGHLLLTDSGTWSFIQRDGHGRTTYTIDLGDLPYTWRPRILDGSLRLGWNEDPRGYHVHAEGLVRGVPGSFKQSMQPTYVDHLIWLDSYTEEYTSLRDQNTFRPLTYEEYEEKYSHIKVIPSMNVQTIKKDKAGVPVRAKSRIVALGNHEDSIWTLGELHAPVIKKESDRLLTTMAVDMGRTQKQGDCKNAFLHPTLPDDEIVIVRPPPGCPFTPSKEMWLLNKTLYGLRRSPKHWYEALKAALLEIGLTPTAHDPCVFTGHPIEGQPPLYLGVYVDDFVYFSISDEVELAFENALDSLLTVDWMGEVGWFLGKAYDWNTTPDGKLQVTITQTAKIEAMLEDNGMSNCNPVKSPYRSGLTFDSIPHDGAEPETKLDIVKPYQRLVGGLNWLSTSTRPDLCVAVSLLSQFSHNPSSGHLEGGRYVLRYLQGTKNMGLQYTQGAKYTDTISGWIHKIKGTIECVGFTDANWGPQDASEPKPDLDETISEDSVRSLLGHCVMRCGGPIAWGCMREPKTSRSSCEAEIFALDEGTKTVEMLRNLMTDLQLPDVSHPTPLLNDNQGSVDWSHGASVSKRLRHLNIREVCVRDGQRLRYTNVRHIPGIFNVADIFTKEHKSAEMFQRLAQELIHARLENTSVLDSTTGDQGGCCDSSDSLVTESCGQSEYLLRNNPFTENLYTVPVENLRAMVGRLLSAIELRAAAPI